MVSWSPFRTAHSGDSPNANLKKRAEYEDDVRNASNKKVSVVLHDLVSPIGFDVGTTHNVFIPACGVNEVLEVVTVKYSAKTPDECQTSLSLSPPPKTKGAAGNKLGGTTKRQVAPKRQADGTGGAPTESLDREYSFVPSNLPNAIFPKKP